MKTSISKYLLGTVFLFFATCGLAQDRYPILTKIVTDSAQIFSTSERRSLREKLTVFERETTNQIVVLTIEKLDNETIEHYGYKTFGINELGQQGKDNGILIVVSKKDRKVRIEVGYGSEAYITDAIASRIIRQVIIPEFKDSDYYEGVDLATNRIIEILKDPEAAAEFAKTEENSENDDQGFLKFFGMTFLAIFVFIGFKVLKLFYPNLVNAIWGLLTGKLSLFYALFLFIYFSFFVILAFSFMALPLFAIVLILFEIDYDNILNWFSGLWWLYISIGLFFGLTLFLALYKIHVYGESYDFSFFKSDRAFVAKNFTSSSSGPGSSNSSSYSSSGSYSSSRSSSSSSSSSHSRFSGGGGSSGGGGASGSW